MANNNTRAECKRHNGRDQYIENVFDSCLRHVESGRSFHDQTRAYVSARHFVGLTCTRPLNRLGGNKILSDFICPLDNDDASLEASRFPPLSHSLLAIHAHYLSFIIPLLYF
jgi:hypothetical protein